MYIVHTSRVALFVPFQAISLMTYNALYCIYVYARRLILSHKWPFLGQHDYVPYRLSLIHANFMN